MTSIPVGMGRAWQDGADVEFRLNTPGRLSPVQVIPLQTGVSSWRETLDRVAHMKCRLNLVEIDAARLPVERNWASVDAALP